MISNKKGWIDLAVSIAKSPNREASKQSCLSLLKEIYDNPYDLKYYILEETLEQYLKNL